MRKVLTILAEVYCEGQITSETHFFERSIWHDLMITKGTMTAQFSTPTVSTKG